MQPLNKFISFKLPPENRSDRDEMEQTPLEHLKLDAVVSDAFGENRPFRL
jgi:hypothetical protein